MRTRYDPWPRVRISRGEIGRRLVQAGTLAYWLPCFSVDFYLLWRDGREADSLSFVFHSLLREAVVYLALWLVIGAALALLFSRRSAEPRRRRRARESGATVNVALSRQHRGL